MSDRQMQTGMDWVETRLSGLAEGQTASINTRGWEIDSTDLTCQPSPTRSVTERAATGRDL